MINKYMDPGYPSFVFTGSQGDLEQLKSKGQQGVLKLVSPIELLASKFIEKDYIVKFNPSKVDDEDVRENLVVPLAQYKKGTPMKNCDAVYICGYFNSPKTLKTALDKIKQSFENVFVINDLLIIKGSTSKAGTTAAIQTVIANSGCQTITSAQLLDKEYLLKIKQ